MILCINLYSPTEGARFYFMKRTLICLLCLTLIGFSSQAQSIVIHGHVMDGLTLEDLANTHVFFNKQHGTSSDIDGRFSIKANYLDTLHFTRLGYDSMAVVVTEMDPSQQLLFSMTSKSIMLKSVEVDANYQANTLIKRHQPQPMKIPGVNHTTHIVKEDYHMGMAALSSPATAIYRVFSKSYKEEKKNYTYLNAQRQEDLIYAKAKSKLDEAFEILDLYLDDYNYRDFILFTGLTEERVSKSTLIDLIKILPEALPKYYTHLEETEK